MKPRLLLAALGGLFLLSAGDLRAAAADFIVPVHDDEQAWVYDPAKVTMLDGGLRRVRIYSVWAQGKPLSGRTVRVVDGVVDFRCETGEFRPVSVSFLDRDLDVVARGQDAGPEAPWLEASPGSRFGLTGAAVCHPEAIAADAHRSAGSLEEAAGVLIKTFD